MSDIIASLWAGLVLLFKANGVSVAVIMIGIFVVFDSYKRVKANKDLYSVLKGFGYVASYGLLILLALKGFDLMVNSSETKIKGHTVFVQNANTHFSFFRISEDVTQGFVIATALTVALAMIVKTIMAHFGKESPTEMIHRLKQEVAFLETAQSGLDIEPLKKTSTTKSASVRRPVKDRPDTASVPVASTSSRAATGPVRRPRVQDVDIDLSWTGESTPVKSASRTRSTSKAPSNRS